MDFGHKKFRRVNSSAKFLFNSSTFTKKVVFFCIICFLCDTITMENYKTEWS